MIFRDTVSPKPVPLPAAFVVKNGSNTRPSLSTGTPVPVSSNSVTSTRSPARNSWVCRAPGLGLASSGVSFLM